MNWPFRDDFIFTKLCIFKDPPKNFGIYSNRSNTVAVLILGCFACSVSIGKLTFLHVLTQYCCMFCILNTTVKPVLSGHSKIDKIKILMTNGSLMKVKSLAEGSPWSF